MKKNADQTPSSQVPAPSADSSPSDRPHRSVRRAERPKDRDRNFDEVFERFQRRVKSSEKGRLRTTLIREDLQAKLPELADTRLQILDGGCGLGDMTLWLSAQGHELDAVDISEKMVDHARHLLAEQDLSERVSIEQKPLQDALRGEKKYDLICIHSAMEWLADPYGMLELLPQSLKPNGAVSLTVYNLHRSIFNSLVKGSFYRVLAEDFSGNRDPLTPPNPIRPERVIEVLSQLGFSLELHAGLRCFLDYLPQKEQEEHNFEDILRLERRYRHEAPYRDIARYVHIIARKS